MPHHMRAIPWASAVIGALVVSTGCSLLSSMTTPPSASGPPSQKATSPSPDPSPTASSTPEPSPTPVPERDYATVSMLAQLTKHTDDTTFRDLMRPSSLTVATDGTLYVSRDSHIEKVTPAGAVSIFVGKPDQYADQDGPASEALLPGCRGLTASPDGALYFGVGSSIKRLTADGVVETFLRLDYDKGTWGRYDPNSGPTPFSLNGVYGFAFDASGNLYLATHRTIRKIAPDGAISFIAGNSLMEGFHDEVGVMARFNGPSGLAVAPDGTIYVADTSNYSIRKIALDTTVTTLAGNGEPGMADGSGIAARFGVLTGMTRDSHGNLYVSDNYVDLTTNVQYSRVRRVTPAGLVSTVTGGAVGDANGGVAGASFNQLAGIAIDAKGKLYLADSYNYQVRMVE